MSDSQYRPWIGFNMPAFDKRKQQEEWEWRRIRDFPDRRWVYLVCDDMTGLSKIGFTKCVYTRMWSLCRYYDRPLNLLEAGWEKGYDAWDNSHLLETQLHVAFRAYRTRNHYVGRGNYSTKSNGDYEWFNLSDSQVKELRLAWVFQGETLLALARLIASPISDRTDGDFADTLDHMMIPTWVGDCMYELHSGKVVPASYFDVWRERNKKLRHPQPVVPTSQ